MFVSLQSTSQSGVEQKKSMNSYTKPDAKKSSDAVKARRWKYCQMMKKPDAEKFSRCWKSIKSIPRSKGVLDIS